MRILLSIIVLAMLAGCGTAPAPAPLPQPVVQEKKTVSIDPTLLQDCPKIKLLPEQDTTREQAITQINNILGALSTCWHRQHDLAAIAGQAFNLTPTPVPAVSK